MEQSPRLSLSYVAPSQAQKHVTVNETFRRLDALAQLAVRSRTVTAEPGAPAEGDAYILPSGANGAAWDNYTQGNLAVFQDGAWVEIAALEGLRAWVSDDEELVVFDGAAWSEISGAASGAAQFGVNTSADATNRLSVKSDAVLFSHDDVTPGNGGAQIKVNKAAEGDTASHLFQTDFSGRAEFGLTGDDDFHIKVSPDNFSTAYEALVIDKDSGQSTFEAGATPVTIVNEDSSSPTILLTNYISSAGGGNFTVQKARGVKSSPDALDSGDIFCGVFGQGYHSGGAFSGNIAFYGFRAHEDFTGAAQGTYFEIATTSDGATSRATRLEVYEGLLMGSATGGDKGAGTINAVAVYDDNSLLSCYVFDQALDGAIDSEKWDAKVPDRVIKARHDERKNKKTGKIEIVEIEPARTERRTHGPMRKFAARIGTEYDPLTLDGYAKHWREKRHLTAMPNEASFDLQRGMAAGEWIQRLVETAEIQAVLIEQLNGRVKTLEQTVRP